MDDENQRLVAEATANANRQWPVVLLDNKTHGLAAWLAEAQRRIDQTAHIQALLARLDREERVKRDAGDDDDGDMPPIAQDTVDRLFHMLGRPLNGITDAVRSLHREHEELLELLGNPSQGIVAEVRELLEERRPQSHDDDAKHGVDCDDVVRQLFEMLGNPGGGVVAEVRKLIEEHATTKRELAVCHVLWKVSAPSPRKRTRSHT